jgi:negative regulator of flagellin synthesis FlgM
MKIQGNNPVEVKDLYGKVNDLNKKEKSGKSSDTEKTSGERDKISLSGKAQEINELKALINDLPDIRTDKVEQLKKAIDTGAYNIDSYKVAEKMLEEI